MSADADSLRGSERDAAALAVKICQWHIFSQSGRKCPDAFWYFSAHEKYIRFIDIKYTLYFFVKVIKCVITFNLI